MEKLDFLINYLLNENTEIKIDNMPKNELEKKKLYRSLCNIREPKQVSDEYLKIENEYLQEELKKKNVIKVQEIKSVSNSIKSNLQNKDKICLWKGDITSLEIEAIVNAANSQGLRLLYNATQMRG